MNPEQPQEVIDYGSMGLRELENDPVAQGVLQEKALEYLKTQDKEWLIREGYTGELSPEGFLMKNTGEVDKIKPLQSVGSEGLLWTVEQAKRELLGDPGFIQSREEV
jgi:hypothetical protein